MTRLNRWLAVATLLAGLALLGAACIPAATQPQATEPPAATQPPVEKEEAPPPTPAEETRARLPRGELTYVTTQTTATFDPAVHVDETQSIHVINTYDSLLIPNPETGEPDPNVATEWEVSDDGRTYVFEIRQGIKFHDGSELTAEDVAFSMDRMLAIGKGFAWLWDGVLEPGSTVALDDYKVEFRLNRPHSPFLATLVQFFIVNKDLIMENMEEGDYEEFGDYGTAFLASQDAGSGAYTVTEYQPGTLTVFEAFPDYWKGWQEDQVARINFRVIGEHATEKLMLESGEADIVEQWLDPQLFADLKEAPGVIVQEDPSAQLFFISMNNAHEALGNMHFRRALSYAFPYDIVAEQIFGGAVQAQGPVPLRLPCHNPNVTVFEQNLEKAREELTMSGIDPSGVQLTYTYVDVLESERKVGLAFQDALRELGIDLGIQGETWARITENVAQPDTAPDMVAIFHTAKYPNPDSHTFAMFHPSAHGTYMSSSWYENERVSQLLKEAREAPDPDVACQKFMEAQTIVTEEAAALFVTNSVHRIAFRERVQGYKYVPILGWDLYYYNLRISG